MSTSLPDIVKTIFIVSNERQYGFDVNHNINFHNLKKMIASAANLEKIGLRIFHNKIEFTKKEDEKLEDENKKLNVLKLHLYEMVNSDNYNYVKYIVFQLIKNYEDTFCNKYLSKISLTFLL